MTTIVTSSDHDGHRSSAVAPTSDSQSSGPDGLRKLADCFDPERMEIAIVLRALADAWQRHIKRMDTAERDRHDLLMRLEAEIAAKAVLSDELIALRKRLEAAEEKAASCRCVPESHMSWPPAALAGEKP
jgi:hypothetical protein